MRNRLGVTALELIVAMLLMAVVLGVVGLSSRGWRERHAVRAAAADVVSALRRARTAAVLSATPVRLELLPSTLSVVIEAAADSLVLVVPGPAARGVRMDASRNTIRFAPSGLGWGAANTSLVFSRGAAAESVIVSRLGRVRRGS